MNIYINGVVKIEILNLIIFNNIPKPVKLKYKLRYENVKIKLHIVLKYMMFIFEI